MQIQLYIRTVTCLLAALTFTSCTKAEEKPAPGEQKNVLGYETGNPDEWPADLDAVIAAPNNHKILLENESVRVLQVSLAPNEIEPLHSHRWRSVLYIQQADDFIDSDENGNVIFDTRALDTPLTFPLTMWKEPEAPHSVTNLSDDTPIRLIRVEIKN